MLCTSRNDAKVHFRFKKIELLLHIDRGLQGVFCVSSFRTSVHREQPGAVGS